MPGKIYLIQNDETLQPLSEQPYANEDLLQTLLEKYPDLLAGDQMNEAAPRRWLLIDREVGIPGEEAGAERWSLDHLFLDQDGIPTLVEVKRSSDGRIRREVVGQMLDYAANAVVYWPVETIRSKFEAGCDKKRADPAQLVADLIGKLPQESADIEAFWSQVKTNLQAAKIRMVFVADEIPAELRRVVEFLNEHMDPVEVLAVEIHQYVGRGLKTLVPRVIGQTAGAQRKKAQPEGEAKQWDETTFMAEIEAKRGTAEAEVAARLLGWAKEKMPAIWWGKGKRDGCFIPGLDHQGHWYQVIGVWTTYGSVELQFQYMAGDPPFDQEAKRAAFRDRLNQIAGIRLAADAISRRPSIPLKVLRDPAVFQQFTAALEWVIEEIKAG